MSRPSVTVLTAIVGLALAAPAAAPAKTKPRCAKAKHSVKHCHKAKKKPAKPKPKPPVQSTTPVHADLLDGSTASITYGDATRTAPLTGRVDGGIPGGYLLGHDNTIKFTGGTIGVGATDLLTDACAGPQPAALDPATAARLDPAKPNSALVARTGDVAATTNVVLRTVLKLRGSACDAPVAQSGYADTALGVTLRGKIVKATGLNALTLDSDPLSTDVAICTAAGAPDQPCPSAPTTLPATLRLHVVVKVSLG